MAQDNNVTFININSNNDNSSIKSNTHDYDEHDES